MEIRVYKPLFIFYREYIFLDCMMSLVLQFTIQRKEKIMKVLLVCVSKCIKHTGMSDYEMYKVSSACWFINNRRNKSVSEMLDIDYVVSIANTRVKAVFRPEEWFKITERGLTKYSKEEAFSAEKCDRWAFRGTLLHNEEINQLLNKVVKDEFKFGGSAANVEEVDSLIDLVNKSTFY